MMPEELRKQATDRLRELRRTDPSAKLSAAQHAIAVEQGFPGWTPMKAYADRRARHPGAQHAFHEELEYCAGRAYGLLASAQDGTAEAVAQFGTGPRTLAGARQVVARSHGFESWAQLRRHVKRLPESGEPFHAAYRAIEAHDPDALSAVLGRRPEIAHASGANGNDLLAMATPRSPS